MTASINIQKDDKLRITSLNNSVTNEPFVVVWFGPLTLLFPGTGRENIAYVRALADELNKAADLADTMMPSVEAVDPRRV